MNRIWPFLTKAIFTLPSWLAAAILTFVIAAYVGYRVAVAVAYRYQESRQFNFSPKDQANRCLTNDEIKQRVVMLNSFGYF